MTRSTSSTTDPKSTSVNNQPSQQGEQAKDTEAPRSATLKLPFVQARFYSPEVRLSKMGSPQIGSAVQGVRDYLPSSRQALYYGGLALVAAVGVVEWPVAAAIGVGTALARKSHDNGEQPGSSSGSAKSEGNPEQGSQAQRPGGSPATVNE